MPVHCPKCGQEHDVVEFEAGRNIKCRCGIFLDISLLETVEDFERYFESEAERKKAKAIKEDAQNICQMILDDGSQDVDIEIAKKKLREKVERDFPDKLDVYKMIYESRFKRLWEQFRNNSNLD